MVCRVVCEEAQEEEAQVEKSKSESHRQRRKHEINHTFENGSLYECLGNRMKIEHAQLIDWQMMSVMPLHRRQFDWQEVELLDV